MARDTHILKAGKEFVTNHKSLPKRREAVKSCPFCKSKPKVTKAPNGKSSTVECTNEECEAWGHKFDLYGWQHRKPIPDITDYLFDIEVIYNGTDFYKTSEYTCKCCKQKAPEKSLVRHKKGCKVGAFLNASR